MRSIFTLDRSGHITPQDFYTVAAMLTIAPLVGLAKRIFRKRKKGPRRKEK